MVRLIKLSIAQFLLVFALLVPSFSFAADGAGLTPKHIFYFLDKASEGVSLFFTFDPGKKAEKILKNAEERLAEADVLADGDDAKGVADLVGDYQDDIKLAKEKSAEIKDQVIVEGVLNLIAENIGKNKEVLVIVQNKVPDEVKAVIVEVMKLTEQVRKNALDEISVLKKEITELKKEIEKLKQEREAKELEVEKKVEQTPSSAPIPTSVSKKDTSIITFPSGAVVEVDAKGNILRFIKEAPTYTSTQPVNPVATPLPSASVKVPDITSVSIVPDWNSARLEWQTNIPTSSKLFLSGGGLSAKIYNSESGLSTRHIVNITGLTSETNYSYEIEAIANGQATKKQGSFVTKIEIKKELNLSASACLINENGRFCDVEVFYSENGERKDVSAVMVSADDDGIFLSSSYPGLVCSGGVVIDSGGTRKGSRLTCSTRPSGRDGKPVALFTYIPSAMGIRTITAVANGLTVKNTSPGQVSVPTKIKVYAHAINTFLDNPLKGPLEVSGASCGATWFAVAIVDQYGEEMAGQKVTLTTPAGSLTKEITAEDFFLKLIGSTPPNKRFYYNPETNNTKEMLSFTSGNLIATTTVQVLDTKSHLEAQIVLREDGSWYEPSSGNQVDPETMTCAVAPYKTLY